MLAAMIHGAHVIVYSKDSQADLAFFRDVLGLPHVDAGHGWLIFGLPPAEVAVHPSEENDRHSLYLMCDDVQAFVKAMGAKGVACGPVSEQRWGLLTDVALPGGGKLGVYQPMHPSPNARAKKAATSTRRPAAKKKPAKKKHEAKKRVSSARSGRRSTRRAR
jgi:catechol 2,3-dioxygenase-like lactoylglutathione lyase family enzyme